jgi:hypothetical protein
MAYSGSSTSSDPNFSNWQAPYGSYVEQVNPTFGVQKMALPSSFQRLGDSFDKERAQLGY